MDRDKLIRGMQLILEGIGEDSRRPGLQRTPERFADMCAEIFRGYEMAQTLPAGFSEDVDNGFILIKDIAFYSMCEHHFLPFFGKVHILYQPQDNRIAGFSAIAKLVDRFANRLQIQERLGRQIADALVEALNPVGVQVVIEATQLCASMRGQHKKEMQTVTQEIRGNLPPERLIKWHDIG
jgi:GTP cyclohydrolase I